MISNTWRSLLSLRRVRFRDVKRGSACASATAPQMILAAILCTVSNLSRCDLDAPAKTALQYSNFDLTRAVYASLHSSLGRFLLAFFMAKSMPLAFIIEAEICALNVKCRSSWNPSRVTTSSDLILVLPIWSSKSFVIFLVGCLKIISWVLFSLMTSSRLSQYDLVLL